MADGLMDFLFDIRKMIPDPAFQDHEKLYDISKVVHVEFYFVIKVIHLPIQIYDFLGLVLPGYLYPGLLVLKLI